MNPGDQKRGSKTGPSILGPAEVGAFVRRLAADVSGGRLELPAFPDVVIKVRQALRDPEISHERLARIVAADAGLAARILTMANSVAFLRRGPTLTDLRKALVRVGLKNVRNAAFAFAMTQLRLAGSVRHIRDDLETLWKDSTLTAALAHVIARNIPGVDPDDALLTGLLHNIGRVYILSRLEPASPLLKDPAARDAVMADWSANVGQAIAENWDMPDPVCRAIAEQDETNRDHVSRADLTDVLIVAVTAAEYYGDEALPHENAEAIRPFEKLGLDHGAWERVVEQSREEIDELKAALGG